MTVDCRDPGVARFWSEALGWGGVAVAKDGTAVVTRSYRNVVLRDPEGNEFCLGGGELPAT